MSQEKVDKYKKEKANRQKLMRREKWVRRLEYTATVLVLGGLITWFSMAVYTNVQAEKESQREATTTIALRRSGRCRLCDPPQAENPAKQDSFYDLSSLKIPLSTECGQRYGMFLIRILP